MRSLAEQPLETCSATSTPLTPTECEKLIDSMDGWQLTRLNDVPVICREFAFRDYKTAMAFALRVGELAEAENHHPRLTIEWGKVSACWWTHSISGLFINDFIMAARCNDAYEGV